MNTCKEAKITMNLKTTQFKGKIKTTPILALCPTLKISMKAALLARDFNGIKFMEMLEIWGKSPLIKGHK